MNNTNISYPIQPNLVEYNTLKKLLKHSYNEGSSPFTQIISKYSFIIKENWFNIIVILFIIIMILLFITKKKSTQLPSEYIEQDPDIEFRKQNIKKQKKYNRINEYYTQNFRLYKK